MVNEMNFVPSREAELVAVRLANIFMAATRTSRSVESLLEFLESHLGNYSAEFATALGPLVEDVEKARQKLDESLNRIWV